MLKINVFAIGTIKEKYLKDAIAEYLKRLSKYAKVEIIELNESKLQNSEEQVIEEEGKSILKRIKDGEHVIKKATEQDVPNYVVSEDYPHEDNSRYEEKD